MPHNLRPEELYQRLIDIAKADGIISSEEQALINNIKENIEKYFEVFNESYADNQITSDEQYNMYENRKRIMDEALKIAKQDHKVTQDEFAILHVVKQILEDMEFNEHY